VSEWGERMDVIYTCDNNYIWIMGISMTSLFESNKSVLEINVYLLGDNISVENKAKLCDIAKKYKRNLNIVDVSDLGISDILYNKRWPKSAYTRLFSGELLPKSIKKALYLDCDTIIMGDISSLWQVDISEYTIYGVKDCIGKVYKENIGLEGNDIYINAGVLLINLEKLRNINIKECINQFIDKYSKVISYSDQDVLNGIFSGKFGILHPKFNVMTLIYMYEYNDIMKIRRPSNYYDKDAITEAKEQPVIVHFTTCMLIIRPWFENSNHPCLNEFNKYKMISPWSKTECLESPMVRKGDRVLNVVFKLPKAIRLPIIGVMHSFVKPYWNRIKLKI